MDSEIILAVLIISLAFGGEAIFGFGGGLISISLLSLFLGVREAITLVLLFQLGMGLLIFKAYKQIDWKIALPMSGGLAIGTITGTLLLAQANVTFLQIFLAGAIALFLIKMVFFKALVIRSTGRQLPATVTGLAGGLLQGLIGTGGQILMMYLSVAISTKARLRATLIYLFFLTSIIRLAISIPQHLITPHITKLALLTLPFFLLAIALGQVLHDKVKEQYYQAAIYIILLTSATLLLIRALT